MVHIRRYLSLIEENILQLGVKQLLDGSKFRIASRGNLLSDHQFFVDPGNLIFVILKLDELKVPHRVYVFLNFVDLRGCMLVSEAGTQRVISLEKVGGSAQISVVVVEKLRI